MMSPRNHVALKQTTQSFWRACAGAIVLSLAPGAGAIAEGLQTEWVEGHNVRTRLVAGVINPATDASAEHRQIVVGLEMELGEGWKTYWRSPGDAGGVPPEFDWSGSTNAGTITVTYPAPHRMTDRSGNTVGYKSHVVFPVHVQPERRDDPVTVKLQLMFGVCKDICVPSEGSYEVTLPPSGAPPVPAVLAEALKRVPVRRSQDGTVAAGAAAEAGASVPRLAKVEAALDGASPKVTMHVSFPRGATGADVFVEGPPGEFIPLPKQKGTVGANTLVFEIDLTEGADVAALRGQKLVATIVSDAAQSEQSFVLK